MKICSKCNQEKPLEEFYKDSNSSDGKRSTCKSCIKISNKEYYSKNKNSDKYTSYVSSYRLENKEKTKIYNSEYQKNNKDTLKIYKREYQEENYKKTALYRARNRAKEANVPMTITESDIPDIPEFCPVLNIPLVKSINLPTKNSPSLDRIVPSLGYVPGNIQWISYKANIVKNDLSLDELVKVGKWAEILLSKCIRIEIQERYFYD